MRGEGELVLFNTRTHLPPPATLGFLDDFYAFASTKRDHVHVLGDKVIAGINVFDHKGEE